MRRLSLALVVVLATACGAVSGATTAPASGAAASPTPEVGEQRQHEAGSVTVSASWVVGTASALVGLSTHSVDLDGFDLRQLARVRLDGGEWVRPTAWDASKGGHHRAGTLTFDTLDPKALAAARLIELEIQNVAVPSHLLRWERTR